MPERPCQSKACADARGNSINPTPTAPRLLPKYEEAPGGTSSFAEPVSLLSTSPADFRLPPTAFARGFDLLTSRTRRKGDSKTCPVRVQGVPKRSARILRIFLFSTFPQRFVQPVEKAGERIPQPGENVRRSSRGARSRGSRSPDPSTRRGMRQA